VYLRGNTFRIASSQHRCPPLPHPGKHVGVAAIEAILQRMDGDERPVEALPMLRTQARLMREISVRREFGSGASLVPKGF
jgi:hypothetical protein